MADENEGLTVLVFLFLESSRRRARLRTEQGFMKKLEVSDPHHSRILLSSTRGNSESALSIHNSTFSSIENFRKDDDFACLQTHRLRKGKDSYFKAHYEPQLTILSLFLDCRTARTAVVTLTPIPKWTASISDGLPTVSTSCPAPKFFLPPPPILGPRTALPRTTGRTQNHCDSTTVVRLSSE